MIISRTPFRISFVGGGTDLPDFYRKERGAVISSAINQYMYVTVNKRFDDGIRVSYSVTEIVEHVDQLKHELIREAMKLTGVTQGVEITTIADVPSRGTGLGSSSALTVGVLNALYASRGVYVTPERLAKEACLIEIEILKQPIGKQDQYVAAYGGFKHLEFHPNDEVWLNPIIISSGKRHSLQENLMLFFTGLGREAATVLHEQKIKIGINMNTLRQMREQVSQLHTYLSHDNSQLDEFGEILHKAWLFKRTLAAGITSNGIDELYQRARESGAIGGKITGAGGGGFLLLYCPKEKQSKVRVCLSALRELRFRFEPEGSKIIYMGH